MAKAEKHKKNLIQQWLEAEEGGVLSRARGFEVLESGMKGRRPALPGRVRLLRPRQPEPKPELALAREPAPPPKLIGRHSQANSPEHLLKRERLPQLRAPFSSRSRQAAPRTNRPPRVVATRAAARRAGGGRPVR